MPDNNEPLIRVEHLKKYFTVSSSLFKKTDLKAVDDVSFSINAGETLGLVGESGCGKSTLGRAIIQLNPQTAGDVYYEGVKLSSSNIDAYAQNLQMIFQDPLSSLNPRMKVEDIIAEPMIVHKLYKSKEEQKENVRKLMELVGLRKDYATRYPHEFSGGQCQRIGIARTLALKPRFIVCDEPVSALDVSIKAQVINEFENIQKEMGIAYLFITHDLLTARYISHRIAVMYLGRLVEIGSTDLLYDNPKHPYTKALLSAVAVPDINTTKSRKRIELSGEIPSPLNAPSGCPFRTRCPYAMEKCKMAMPELKEVDKGRSVACFLYE